DLLPARLSARLRYCPPAQPRTETSLDLDHVHAAAHQRRGAFVRLDDYLVSARLLELAPHSARNYREGSVPCLLGNRRYDCAGPYFPSVHGAADSQRALAAGSSAQACSP